MLICSKLSYLAAPLCFILVNLELENYLFASLRLLNFMIDLIVTPEFFQSRDEYEDNDGSFDEDKDDDNDHDDDEV